MAYYVYVIDVIRRATGVTVRYELRNDTVAPFTVIDTGSMGLEFSPVGTAQERRQNLRQSIIENFQSLITRAQMADADFEIVKNALIGTRYP